MVAAALTILVNAEEFENRRHAYDDIVGGGEMAGHDPDGNALYGVDIFVDPDYHGLRLGRRLYDARKELCETLNLKSIIFGGRIPGYGKHSDEMAPAAYIRMAKYEMEPLLPRRCIVIRNVIYFRAGWDFRKHNETFKA